MRRAIFVAVLLVSLIVVPAHAEPRLRLIATGTGPVRTDARYAAYARDQSVIVIDTSTGRSQTLSTPPGCKFENTGGGAVLWECLTSRSGERIGHVVELATGKVAEIDTQSGAGSEVTFFVAVGSQWIEAPNDEPHTFGGILEYVNWRTGSWDGWAEWDHPTVFADLNAPSLARPLCAPTHRAVDPDADELDSGNHRYLPVQYDHPYALVERPAANFELKWVLRRCGSQRRLLSVDDLRLPPAVSPQLAGGWVTWQSQGDVFAFRPSDGRRLHFELSAGLLSVAHTANDLFITVAASDGGGRVYEARLPR